MIPTSMFLRMRFMMGATIAAMSIAAQACYYPAQIQPPPQAKNQAVVTVPYDLTWDALHSVVAQNNFRILGDDPNHGIIEADAHSFTLADADCGQLKSVGSRYDVAPDPGGGAVFNFHAEPAGPEATTLSVTATYSTPVHVAFRPVSNIECISRGVQEARLLSEIVTAAHSERRPTARMEDLPLAPRSHSLMGPDILKRPTAQKP
jgi:hypothetical protein